MGCAEWKKGAHSSGEMNRAAELFSDDVMGYTARSARGAALGYPEQAGGVTDLLGAREEIGANSLEDQRYLMRGGGNVPGAPMKNMHTVSRVSGLSKNDMYGLPQNGRNMFNNVGPVTTVTNVGPINWSEYSRRVPMTPKKGLGSGLGNAGMLPGEEKPVPGAPKKLQFGGRRSRRRSRRSRTSKSFLNIRVTGRIRMKQRHRQ